MLVKGAANPASRYAVFLFSWFLRDRITSDCMITQPTLVVVGDQASSISRAAGRDTLTKDCDYLECLPQGKVEKCRS